MPDLRIAGGPACCHAVGWPRLPHKAISCLTSPWDRLSIRFEVALKCQKLAHNASINSIFQVNDHAHNILSYRHA